MAMTEEAADALCDALAAAGVDPGLLRVEENTPKGGHYVAFDYPPNDGRALIEKVLREKRMASAMVTKGDGFDSLIIE